MNADITATGGFNTGRLYTRNGQRIFWVQHDNGWLYFDDRDRMVDGWLKRDPNMLALNAEPSPKWLVNCYDAGKYEPDCPDDPGRKYHPDLQAPPDFDYGEPLNI